MCYEPQAIKGDINALFSASGAFVLQFRFIHILFVFLHYVFSNVSSPWQKVLKTSKSLFTLYKQIPKNPGISCAKIPEFL